MKKRVRLQCINTFQLCRCDGRELQETNADSKVKKKKKSKKLHSLFLHIIDSSTFNGPCLLFTKTSKIDFFPQIHKHFKDLWETCISLVVAKTDVVEWHKVMLPFTLFVNIAENAVVLFVFSVCTTLRQVN